MGGFGSGRHGWRHRCEHYPALTIRRLQDAGMLRPGAFVGWGWAEHDISVTLSAEADLLQVAFANPERGYYGGPIRLETRSAGFGGVRRFFSCPRCWNARTRLYLRHGRFLCRVCHGLKYVSQTLDYAGRQHRAIDKLSRRLAKDGEKPDRMRWHTYNGLIDRLNQRERNLDVALFAKLAGLGLVDDLLRQLGVESP